MGYRILVAEDDRGLNQGIRLALQKEDVIFDAAYTLEEARRLWREEKPDMVLLDVNFPDGSGFDFLRQLRASSAIPVLMITANDMETDEVTGLTLGADDYITKPFSLMALRARVENIRKRTERAGLRMYEAEGYRFDFEKLQFRVGEIIACEEVKKSKKLLCSQVRIGRQVKQIVHKVDAYMDSLSGE